MADVWTIRGVPENTQERAKAAAKQSGITVGELVTECIHWRLNKRREDEIAEALNDLNKNVTMLAKNQEKLAKEVLAIHEQIAKARVERLNRITDVTGASNPPKSIKPDALGLSDLTSAYANLQERLAEEKRRRRQSGIDRAAG